MRTLRNEYFGTQKVFLVNPTYLFTPVKEAPDSSYIDLIYNVTHNIYTHLYILTLAFINEKMFYTF
jgi:hypothetical protein